MMFTDRIIPDDLDDIQVYELEEEPGTGTSTQHYSVGPLHVPRRLAVVQIGGKWEALFPQDKAVHGVLLRRLNGEVTG